MKMKKDFFYSLHYSNLNTPPPFLYELTVDFTIHPDKVDIKYISILKAKIYGNCMNIGSTY